MSIILILNLHRKIFCRFLIIIQKLASFSSPHYSFSSSLSFFDANLGFFRGVYKAADLVQSTTYTLSSSVTSVWNYVTSFTKSLIWSEEVLNLETDIARLEGQIKELNEQNWGLILLESFRAECVAYPGFLGYLEWLDQKGMQDHYVSTLKKELDIKNARLRFIQMDN